MSGFYYLDVETSDEEKSQLPEKGLTISVFFLSPYYLQVIKNDSSFTTFNCAELIVIFRNAMKFVAAAVFRWLVNYSVGKYNFMIYELKYQ